MRERKQLRIMLRSPISNWNEKSRKEECLVDRMMDVILNY